VGIIHKFNLKEDGMAINWTTHDELEYLSNTGINFSNEHPRFIPPLDRMATPEFQDKQTVLMLRQKVLFLKRYIKLADLRHKWGSINKIEVLNFAKSEKSRLERDLAGD
jgi:hypothetical protein